LDLPDGYIADATERERVLDAKPRHWRMWYEGTFISNYEAPAKWVPKTLTADNVREVNAMAHIENELIDEAIGRVLASVASRGWGDDVDVLYTTDHGELQGDYGLLFKGPYHTDSLMRLPLLWRPAASAKVAPARVSAPVGLVSLAATFASIAGLARPDYTESERLPVNDGEARELGHERVLTEWDSVLFGKIVHARTICRDGMGVYGNVARHRARRHGRRVVRPGQRPTSAQQPLEQFAARSTTRCIARRHVVVTPHSRTTASSLRRPRLTSTATWRVLVG